MVDDDAAADRAARRRATRELVVAGGVTGPRDLARRLADRGFEAAPDALRSDLRAIGVVKVVGPEGTVLAVPAEREAADGGGLVAEITADPDWKLHVVVLTVVLAFLLAGLVGWLLGP